MRSTLFRNMTAFRALLAGFMTLMGVLHFTHDQVFAAVVPDYLPQPMLLVYLSGICEIALGLGLLFERTRVVAAWGLMALFVAVFPANLHMALHPDLPLAGVPSDMRPSALALWLRLPLQLV
ncbi:MAG TPA: hypothetical protein VFZ61_29750, partial [Polyangiales bacterium]